MALLFGAAGCDEAGLGLTPPYLTASTEKIDFGERVVGTPEQRSIFVLNMGQVPMKLEEPIGDTYSGVFSLLLDSFSVQPTKDVVINVGFVPADPMTYTTTITIANDSSNHKELRLILTGRGVRPGPCDNVSCREAPSPTCIAENTTRRFQPAGVCQDGTCVHEYADENCMFGCDDNTGACRGDPCVGMSCTTPPNNCYFANGTCANGACNFNVNNAGVCDDSNVCTTADHCAEGTCVGTPTACSTPPDALCVDASTRRVFNATGACNPANGGCEYQSQDQHCQFGCDPAGCLGDPCAGIVCNTPPNSQCYQATGTCANGICSYATAGGNCDDGDACTTADACNAGTCAGTAVTCNSPPPADCPTAGERRVYNAVGTCSAGICNYGSTTASCDDNNACTVSDICTGGVCVNSGALNCADTNGCTNDSCDPIAGCVHAPTSGTSCVTSSGDCPTGLCSAGTCLPVAGVTCQAEYDRGLCETVQVAGTCSGNGNCVVSNVPPQFQCPGCNGICLQCFFLTYCIQL